MGRQIIKQPDGKYAVWSSVVDGFIILDATREELIEEMGESARKEKVQEVTDLLDSIDKGERPYHQFTLTWSDPEVQEWLRKEKEKGNYVPCSEG